MKNWQYSGTRDNTVSIREKKQAQFARMAAAEGIVLLKNEALLPLCPDVRVALFGPGAVCTVKGGIGSGDVNNRESVSLYQGFTDAKAVIVSRDWLEDYRQRYTKARLQWKRRVLEAARHVDNPFDAYAVNPFAMPEGRPVCSTDLEGAEVIIYMISRISGEGKDRQRTKGDYYLSEREKEDLLYIKDAGLPVILLINAGGPVELTGILDEVDNIRAVLQISQPGQEAGHAVCDVLYGKTVPGGKLTATWAKAYQDYPSADTFSYLNNDLEEENYTENIYVGYRYFDSFDVKPLFGFGFGLSYTEFEILFKEIKQEGDSLYVDVAVENIGTRYAGKEVVQIYASLPQNTMEKEFRRLVGYQKTKTLLPGETQELSIRVRQKELAAFHEDQHAWILEAGMYGIWIGNSLDAAALDAVVEIEVSAVLEQTKPLQNIWENPQIIKNRESLLKKEALWKQLAELKNISPLVFEPQPEEAVICSEKPETAYETEKLLPLLYGNIAETTSTLGAAGVHVPGSAGETTWALLDEFDIPPLVMADGPAGIRLQQSYEVDTKTDTVYGVGVLGALENGFLIGKQEHEAAQRYYQYCTAFPVGTALAQSWDPELMRAFGEKIAVEMQEFHVQLWLAPGLNIHRNPLCGRNFEYYAEDPLLAGTLTAAVTAGVQSHAGCGVTIKHFACNNQEDNRMGVNVHVTERSLREIYLRGFEIAVKESAPAAIMSSYNLVNGVHAANSYDLCTTITRDEWGYTGVIMSDWNTTVPEDGSIPWKCTAAGNDIIMPGNAGDAENIQNAWKRGLLSEEKIRCSAGRVLRLIRRLS